MSNHYETAAPDRYELLKDFAQHNRHEMTESEKVLWNALRKTKFGFRFRRQHPIGDYIADFVCLPVKLVIEVDGGYHLVSLQQELDQQRTDFLESKGYKVIRIKNEEISNDLNDVVMRIKTEVLNQSNDSPRPLERGRG
ncbi:MAG: endonuclease domain-containing protein [Prevotella sp.]|nr:endonuclease domain-containing protein [Prevotella sp.]